MSRRTLLDRDLDISWLDPALQVAADRASTMPPRQRLEFSLQTRVWQMRRGRRR